ncbi:MAG: glutamate 5-kinase, partial [Stenotrophomonas sp.]|nr:glutamate 5-kinase [Stenotrophomonas sp.]
AAQSREAARKYWLRHAPVDPGVIWIDDGAVQAMRGKGASLLPGGITGAEGEFRRGDMVEIRSRHGDAGGEVSVARGVTQYAASDIRRIAGRHSRDIEGALGYNYGGSVVHRDDLVLV